MGDREETKGTHREIDRKHRMNSQGTHFEINRKQKGNSQGTHWKTDRKQKRTSQGTHRGKSIGNIKEPHRELIGKPTGNKGCK